MTETDQESGASCEYTSGTVGALCEVLASHWDIPASETMAVAQEVGLPLSGAAFPSSLLSILLSGSYLTEPQVEALLAAPCRLAHTTLLFKVGDPSQEKARTQASQLKLVNRFLDPNGPTGTLATVFERYANAIAADPGKALGATDGLYWGVVEGRVFARLDLDSPSGYLSLFFGDGPLDELLEANPEQFFQVVGPLLERAVLSMATAPGGNVSSLHTLRAVSKEAH